MHLLILPVEILELIIVHIPNTKDLLALALTTRQLSDFIIPFHLQFRRIRCLANTSTLWFNLKKHPDICLKIREIELYNGNDAAALHLPRRPHIPQPLLDMDTDPAVLWPPTATVIWNKSWVDKENGSLPTQIMRLGMRRFISSFKRAEPKGRNKYVSKESLLAFCGTLPLLTNLTRFSLKNPYSNLSIDADLLRTTLTAVVRSNHGLRELAIVWKMKTSLIDSNPFVSLWELSGLTSFELSINSCRDYTIYSNQCTDMLVKRCPDLNNLSLTGKVPDKLWETANWKQLRRLSVRHFWTFKIFKKFLKRHPQIECLETSVLSLGLDDLTYVRALTLPCLPSYLTTEREKDVLSRLEYISLREAPEESVICLASSLRALVVDSSWYRIWYITALPSTLERLCIDLRIPAYSCKDAGKEVVGILERKSNLKSLTHLCISVSPEWIPHFQTRGFLRRLARILPSLKYFGLALYNRRKSWIRICRNGKGIYIGYELDDTVEEVQKWAFSFIS